MARSGSIRATSTRPNRARRAPWPWLGALAVTIASAPAMAAPASPLAIVDPRPPVCARMIAAYEAQAEAEETAPAPRDPRTRWFSWTVLQPADLAEALVGKVTHVRGTQDGMALAVATDAQIARLPAGISVMGDAEDRDWVVCGSVGYRGPALGRIALPSMPARWQHRGTGRARYCVQTTGVRVGDDDHAAVATIFGAADPAPMTCSGEPTCTIEMTARQAAAVARLPFVRGVFRYEPAFKIDAGLACVEIAQLPIAPADVPEILRAATARPDERVDVTVELYPDPDTWEQFRDGLPRGAVITFVDTSMPMLSLPRRSLRALAALPMVLRIFGRSGTVKTPAH